MSRQLFFNQNLPISTSCSISVFVSYQLFFSAYMPLVWLKAYIRPIYKKGDSSKVCNLSQFV